MAHPANNFRPNSHSAFHSDTARGGSDVDLFISLKPEPPGPLNAIQPSLLHHVRGYLPLTRNVSVRIIFESHSIDLVPARRRADSTHHTLWQSRYNTWLQTGIAEQTRYVRDSGLIDEVLALKLWRRSHALRFPSFVLELATIRALKPNRPIAAQFQTLLEFLSTDFPTATLLDPANSNNVVSDLLTRSERDRIAASALLSPHCCNTIPSRDQRERSPFAIFQQPL